MLHAAVAPHPSSDFAPTPRPRTRIELARSRSRQDAFRITWSSVEIDGEALTGDDEEQAVSLIAEAFQAVQTEAKDEMLIVNVAPDEPVGSARISDLQGRIEQLVRQGAARVGRDAPEMRLSLRGVEYDIRCYMGRYMPTDYDFNPEA